MADLNGRVSKIVKEVFAVNESSFTDDSGQQDIPTWDSLNHVMLVSAIEKEFNISLEMTEIQEIKTVGDIKKIVNRHLPATPAA
ncbi:MAG: acyl carrier protein [Elusimicrobia bacterium]|nr:acyl carrier protein [Elusimicrobiota bacterium]